MKNQNIIYDKNRFDGFERLSIDGQILRYSKKEFLNIREIETPLDQLKREIEFDKSYHFILILISVICLILSCLLIYKFYNTEDWRKYLGISVFIFSILGIAYYVLVERKYGTTIIKCKDEFIKIRTKSDEYEVIRISIMNKLMVLNEK